MIKEFTDEDKEVIRMLLEKSDEELYDIFEPVLEAVKEKLDPIKRKLRQRQTAVYSNMTPTNLEKKYQHI